MTCSTAIIRALAAGLVCGLTAAAQAQTTWYVDGVNCNPGFQNGSQANPYCEIDTAIESPQTASGDTVIIADGLYTSGSIAADFGSRNLRVRSANGPENCIIDCSNEGPAFTLQGGQNASTVIEGLTMRDCFISAIRVQNASPTIRNCVFENNRADQTGVFGSGGAVRLVDSDTRVIDSVFRQNYAQENGGAIFVQGGRPAVVNCRFEGNGAGSEFGADAIPTLQLVSDSSGNHFGVAYHPVFARYYASLFNLSNRGYVFNSAGQLLQIVNLSYSPRSWNFNPTTNQLEVVVQNAVTGAAGGLVRANLNASGNLTGTATVLLPAMTGVNGPESMAVFDQFDNVFYSRSTGPRVNVVSRANGQLVRTFDLQNAGSLTDYAIAFNPRTRHLITTQKSGTKVYVHDTAGQLLRTYVLPQQASVSYGLSYTNDQLFVRGNNQSTWQGYQLPGESNSLPQGVGGAICAVSTDLDIVNCTFAENGAQEGGALWMRSTAAQVVNSLLVENYALGVGGAVCLDDSHYLELTHCTIAENTAAVGAGGLHNIENAEMHIDNSILWNNHPVEIIVDDNSDFDVLYSDVAGGWPGTGNINADPQFWNVDPLRPWFENDYRLATLSPCSDAGSNALVPQDFADLDGDGNVSEVLPLDLDASPRITDNEERADTGQGGGGAEGVADMGSYELAAYCLADELPPPADIAGAVDYAATLADPNSITPVEAAFVHAMVPCGPGCTRPGVFAGEGGASVSIDWQYREQPGGPLSTRTTIYRVGRCVREDLTAARGHYVAGVQFYKSYPEADARVREFYDVVIRYNGLIKENLNEGPEGVAGNPDLSILADGFVQVSEDCPEGRIVLQYDEFLGGPLVGFEVVNITEDGAAPYTGPLAGGAVAIGRQLPKPGLYGPEVTPCRAVVIRNEPNAGGVPVAWHRGNDTLPIYPIRPETLSQKFIVGWYRSTPMENCWPQAVYRYTTDWPTDPQLHVIDATAGAGAVIPAGSRVDARPDLYCGADVMYQQSFNGGEPPFGHITAAREFAARRPGYSVVRFDIQPDEISDCGADVAFEVIASYDRSATPVFAPADHNVSWPIGRQLDCTGAGCGCIGLACDDYFDPLARTYRFGFLFIPPTQMSAPYNVGIHQASGQIFPINDSAHHGVLEAWWYEEGAYAPGIYWPNKVVTYNAVWPPSDDPADPGDNTADPSDDTVVIASRRGAGAYPEMARIYDIGNVDDPEFGFHGWNPNDEHAILLPIGDTLRVFAVRNDDPRAAQGGAGVQSGHPYALVEYPDPDHEGRWKMGVHHVVATDAIDDFYYTHYTAIDGECGCGEDGVCTGGWSDGLDCDSAADCVCSIELPVVAGQPIDPLFPVNFGAAACVDDGDTPALDETYVEAVQGDAVWVDSKGGIWAVEDWSDDNFNPNSPVNSTANIFLWENWAGDFGCQPWLANGPAGVGGDGETPWPITYDPVWPPVDGHDVDMNGESDCAYPEDVPCAPLRHIGATFDQSGQCGRIKVLHDTVNVRIIDPTREVRVPYPNLDLEFEKLPPHLFAGEIGGGGEWPDRIRYDFATSELVFRGIMSDRDHELLRDLDPDCASVNDYCGAVDDLYVLSREQLNPGFEAVGDKFISLADQSATEGWLTVAFQNDVECTDTGLPVSVETWRVECPPDQGFIRPIQPKCPLSEKLILQFSGDGGGRPEELTFQWQWSVDYQSSNPQAATWNDYAPPPGYESGYGLREVLIEGASLFTLQDSYWRVRYHGYNGCPCRNAAGNPCTPADTNGDGLPDNGCDCNHAGVGWDEMGTQISNWTEVQLAESWIKRVIRGLNPFDQRIEDFHVNEAATYVDMIRQAGKRFVEPVPLNCDPANINDVGLIELYETVLRRARSFSIDQGISMPGVTKAILLAAGKIVDLNMLLGHEAYADALDPTVGVFADQGELSGGYDPHAVHCFEEQVATMLDEELALLRGRDATRSLDHDADGRIIATVDNRLPWNFTSGNGQVAYANNYQLLDIDEAVATYPQGHGDAWGYYLNAMKKYYSLLQHPIFDWLVLTEDVLVAGQPVAVGYMHERRFAAAAAAKARAGAAVTALTFRERYSSSVEDQALGYPDNARRCFGGEFAGAPCQDNGDCTGGVCGDRAWGLADWGSRSGQGAYFDWLTANALLPGEDTEHEGIQKIDRTTVMELNEIAGYCAEIQSILDEADAGLNPLGLAHNVVPFGLDPDRLAEEGDTHFDQVSRRALVALNNAATAFDYANSNTQRLRSMQDDVDGFEDLVEERELDFNNRMIEVFGTPYAEDIGPGRTYPEGYAGPDIFHFGYMDDSNLLHADAIGTHAPTSTTTISVLFQKPDFDLLGSTGEALEAEDVWEVKYNVATDGLGLIKPAGWGQRPVPGEIQFVRGELVQAIGRYRLSLETFESLIDQIEDQAALLSAFFGLNDEVLGVLVAGRDEQKSLNDLIAGARQEQLDHRRAGNMATIIANAAAEAIPTAVGFSNDVGAPARAAIRLVATAIGEIQAALADQEVLQEFRYQQDKELVTLNQQITIAGLESQYQEQQQVVALKQLIRALATVRLDLYSQEQAIRQATGRYHAAVGRGLRLLDERTAFRHRTADQVTKHRYRDMAFRVFRNDALAKYRAQFDLAGLYVYLAAKAYDYETNLLGSDPMGGQRFLDGILRERSLGVVSAGVPYAGRGLAGRLAEMASNFEVLRSSLGLDNADQLERSFSLRWEHFRIPTSVGFDADWRAALTASVVGDLNTWDVYRQFCQPLMPPHEVEPAIVIPFSTTVTSGMNLFGWNSNGDEILPPDRFAIKIHSISVGLSQSYASPPLNREVPVYLVPAGADVMRVPTDGSIREWNVLDQVLPVPFPLSAAELQEPDWLPWDSLVGGAAAMVHRQRIPTVTACALTADGCDLTHKLVGRSVWNTQWYLVIPGSQLMGEDPEMGIDLFINGANGTGVRDIKLTFEMYGYSGNVQGSVSASAE